MSGPSVVVYGPQACGKTRNSERLRAAFGMSQVLDCGMFIGPVKVPPRGALVLTNDRNIPAPPGVQRVAFSAAMRKVGAA